MSVNWSSIMQEGTNNGVITDIDGNYSIEIKGVAQATLVYSYIGMQQQQHVVTPQTQKLDITLKSDAQLVDEVVVVAYGVRKKGTVTGSVSTIKAERKWKAYLRRFRPSPAGTDPRFDGDVQLG